MRFALLTFIRRFGWRRGLEFRRVARLCDQDPRLLKSWIAYYRGRGSRELYHDNKADGHAFIAFAEMLQTAHDQIVEMRPPRRPILTRNQQRLEKRFKRIRGTANDLRKRQNGSCA
jgi:hypothetical protein